MVGLKSLRICLVVSMQYGLTFGTAMLCCDGRTDGQRDIATRHGERYA